MNRRHAHGRPTPSLTPDRDESRPGLCWNDPYWFDQAIEARQGSAARDYATAKARSICAECPLTGLDGACLKDNREAPGIVAGMTMQERKKIARRKPCGTSAAAARHRKAKEPLDHACKLAEVKAARERKERRKAKDAAA